MSKRFATIFFITVATIMILAVVFFMVLFLAPGVTVFGIRYIGQDLHKYESGKIELNKEYGGDFSALTLNTHEVPVNVYFTESMSYYVEYYCNFNGITNSKISDPSMKIERKGTEIIITTSEYHKVIYETSSSERYINLYIPLVSVSGAGVDYTTALEINSNKSPITFTKDDRTDERTPTFNTISLTTNGKVNYNTPIMTNNFRLSTSSSIKVNENWSNFIYSTNYSLKSTSGKIELNCPVSGNLDLETKNGSISLVSCKNLYAKSSHGSIKSAGENPVKISGIVDIETKSGSVTLGDINGIGENKIKTSSGKVVLGKIKDGTIITQRGSVTIKSVSNATIDTNVGNVIVEESLGSIVAKTKRGNITLGGENLTMNNATVFSRLGKVNLKSADGTTSVETISSNVNIKNRTSENFTIKCGGRLNAEGLTGKVNIFAEKDSTVSFSRISDVSVLDFGASAKEVSVYALGNTKDDIGYRVYGSSVIIKEYRNNAYITYDGTNGSGRDKYEYNVNWSTYLKLTSKDNKAKVNLFFKAPN